MIEEVINHCPNDDAESQFGSG